MSFSKRTWHRRLSLIQSIRSTAHGQRGHDDDGDGGVLH